jgi:hypothetical protein
MKNSKLVIAAIAVGTMFGAGGLPQPTSAPAASRALANRSRHSFVSRVLMIGHFSFLHFRMPGELEPELCHPHPVVLRGAGGGFPGKHERVRCIFAVLP